MTAAGIEMPTSATLNSIQALALATAGALCALLFFMQWSASRRGGEENRYRFLWVTGFLYASGAFAAAYVGMSTGEKSHAAIAESLAWISTCLGPLLFSEIGSAHVQALRARRVLHVLARAAFVLLLARFVVVAADTGFRVGDTAFPMHSFYVSSAFALVYAGFAVVGRPVKHPPQRAIGMKWFGPTAALLALAQGAATLILIHDLDGPGGAPLHTALKLISTMWILPWTLLLAFFLAQTRYADVALKRSLLVVAAVCIAGFIAWWIPGVDRGAPYVTVTLIAAGFLIIGPATHRAMHWLVDRWLLRRPQYRSLAQEFATVARRVANTDELFEAATRLIVGALHVDAVFHPNDASIDRSGAIGTLPVGDHHSLVIFRRSGARLVMQEEFWFLERIALEIGHRIDALTLEADRHDLRLQHERLQRSLTEAELKALRAQVDPHFLFNTLNTIAELVRCSPQQAEAMTERLAECFRYALTRQEKTLSTLEEELLFIRRYLDIEQVRFGSRLTVEMSCDADVAHARIPSLILQPLVENAVRHGLAPKPEGGRLRVRAHREGDDVRVEVCDDGVGMKTPESLRLGVGLRNVRERLQTLYRGRGSMTIGADALGRGTSIILLMPRHDH